MRTSEEIFHRVRWDARFDPARFVMGVNRRGAGVKRMPLTSFVPGGEIPWHRVLFIEADGELVWDRASGADLIGSTGAGLARDPRRLRAPFFEPLAFDGPAGRTPDGGPIRVLTWNTLWDRYGSEHIDTARRRPLLLAALREADADVIALQEVEPELLAMVRAQPWIHDTYTLSPGTREVAEYGLLLLSRAPVREVGRHAFGPHKAVLAMVVETGHGPLTVATTHLTSDHSAEGPASREKQLARLTEGLAGVPGDVVLMGDFNDATDRPQRTLDLDDAWIRVHGPGDDRPTFDPSANPLAALGSLTGEPGRIDRVLLRGPVALRAVLRGEGEFISDHYGVEVELTGAPDAGAGGARAGGARDAGAGARDTGAEGARVVARDTGAEGARAGGARDAGAGARDTGAEGARVVARDTGAE
ncbi:RNA repair domain-containing protein, partial [Streptomyces sp. NPDC014894]|uniref:RNA repair domain-containing protein n=1 Tax=Streptomyces sp. NPDC014894 TaxID=3364931 RepID=UPI0036FFFABA